MRIPFLSKEKFVLIIGDDGAILSYVKSGKIEKRIFAKSSAMSDRRELSAVLKDNVEVPIYVLIDSMEQSFTKQTLPAVSSFAVGKLLEKRLQRDFAESDIKGAMLLGRETSGRHDWIYLFSATPLTESLSEWISYIESLENRFAGIYMLPIEMESLVKKLVKTLPTSEEKKKDKSEDDDEDDDEYEAPVDWHFIATFNKTGGVRQVVLENGKVVFTRLIKTGKDNLPDIIAGNIEQEILNTVDYMRRLSFKETDNLDVMVAVPADIKNSMQGLKINGKLANLYTPFELSEAIGLKGVASQNDKFADLVIAANFANSSASLRLTSSNMKKLDNIVNIHRISTAAILAAVPIFMVYTAVSSYSVYGSYDQIKKLENQKAAIEKRWKSARQTEEYSIDEANRISDFISFHKKLSNTTEPFDIIKKIAVDNRKHVSTRSIAWNYDVKTEGRRKKIVKSEKVLFNLEFYNKGKTLDELFKNFDEFSANVKLNTEGYHLDLSDLPEKIDFNNKERIIPIKISLTTKNSKK